MDTISCMADKARELGCIVEPNERMSRHTTFKIGGPADLFITVHTKKDFVALLRLAEELEMPSLVIGNGSNMLVSDCGIQGCVFSLDGEFSQIELLEDNKIRCGCGASLAGLCNFAKKNGLTGLEFAWGIPGSVGGATFMNAGAYGGQMSDVVASCAHMTRRGEEGILPRNQLDFSYRHSAYADNGCFIISTVFQLAKGDPLQIEITMEDYYTRRKEKQPMNKPSAGSVFKRPENSFAGTLIEQCGLKGRQIGGAVVSEKHAGFIVNAGSATCQDVLDLIALIQKTVREQKNVSLECEVKMIG